MTKDQVLQMCLEYIETDAHERKYVRHAIKQALAAQQEHEPENEPHVSLASVQDNDAHYKGVVKGVQKLFDDKRAQPAAPDAIHHTDTSETLEYINGWNDCRQAMLEMMK